MHLTLSMLRIGLYLIVQGLIIKEIFYLSLYSRELEITLISKMPRLRSRLCHMRARLQ